MLWGACPLELLQGVQAAGVLHGNVQQHDIGVQPFDQFDQLRAITGFANDGIARDIHDQRAYAGPDQGVVIYQKQITNQRKTLFLLARSRARGAQGKRASMCVPFPASLMTLRVPPNCSTRSDMPAMPR